MNETIVATTETEVAVRRPGGPGADELLFGLAACVPLVRAADGRLHARVPVNGRQEIYALKSPAFRNWLIDRFRTVVRQFPPQRAVRRVVEALEARAQFEDHTPPVYVRVGRGLDDDASTFYLDRGDSSQQAVAITASGWSIVETPPVHFTRPRGLLPLDPLIRAQMPKTPGAFGNELRRLAPQLREYGISINFKKNPQGPGDYHHVERRERTVG